MDKRERSVPTTGYVAIAEKKFEWLLPVALLTFFISLSPYLFMLEKYLTGINVVSEITPYPPYSKYLAAIIDALLIFVFIILFLLIRREIYKIAPSIFRSLTLSSFALALALILAMGEVTGVLMVPESVLTINNYVYNLSFFVSMYFVYVMTSFISEIRPFKIRNKIFSGMGLAFFVVINAMLIYTLTIYGANLPDIHDIVVASISAASILGLVLDAYLLTRFIYLESLYTLIDLADLSVLTIIANIIFNEMLLVQIFLPPSGISYILVGNIYYMGIASSLIVSILIIISINLLQLLHLKIGEIKNIGHILVEADFNKPIETYERIGFFLSLILPKRENINFILATRPGSLIADTLALRFPKSRITRIDIIPGKSTVSREDGRFESPPSPVHLLYAIREALGLVREDELPVLIIDTLTDIEFLVGDINTYTFLRNLVSRYPDLLSLYIVNREAHTIREINLFRNIINRVIEI
ncbi:MAG: hypothetical protein GXO43_07115 [Crenarchaeota archaeon]|nr:hypothetical protein [Thermoproteota archaeon]